MKTFLGIPLWICAAVCFVLACLWLYFWPQDPAGSASPVRLLILRWFHAVTWALLGVAAISSMIPEPWALPLSRGVAAAALVTYLLFVAAVTRMIR